MNREVVYGLRERAHWIANILGRSRLGGDWASWDPDDGLQWTIIDEGDKGRGIVLKFRPNTVAVRDYAFIELYGITPKDITKTVYHDAVVVGQKMVDADVTDVVNNTDHDQTYTYGFESSTSTSFEQAVGVAVETSIQQSISYGSDLVGAKGETELGLKISADYKQTSGITEDSTRSSSTEVICKAGKKTNIVNRRSVGEYNQKIEYWGDLEHGIRLYSDNDYDYHWDTLAQLKDTIDGFEPQNTSLALYFREQVRKLKNWEYNRIFGSLNLHYEDTLKFKKASTGNIIVTEKGDA